jgi:hypothetical protein
MEFIIKDQLIAYLLDKGIINKHQHAFIKKTILLLQTYLRVLPIGLLASTQRVVRMSFILIFPRPLTLLLRQNYYSSLKVTVSRAYF